jgi:signal transduction histidine kinase
MLQTLRSIFYLELHSLPDHEPRKRLALGVNFTSLCISYLLAVGGTLAAWLTRDSTTALTLFLHLLLLAVVVLLNQVGWYRLAAISLVSIAVAAVPWYYHVPDTPPFLRILNCAILAAIFVCAVILHFKQYRFMLSRLRDHAREVETNLESESRENEKKDLFISNAYHEIRSSFFSIFSIINLFNREKAAGLRIKEWKKAMSHLWTACQIQTNLIDNILGYERFESSGATSIFNDHIDIRTLIQDLVDIYQYSAEEKMVRISSQIPDDATQLIFSDRVKLIQILSNLLSNAIKYTRRESEIIVHVRIEDGCWKISVQDQGEGISDEKRQRIFEPFYSESPTGIGLGLYITKRTVEVLGGTLEVSSIPGYGARFTVTLPHYAGLPRQQTNRLEYFNYS